MSIDQASWEAAVRHLYEDGCAFNATGPRKHEDWRADVLAVMERAVPDPRGWIGLDDTADYPYRTELPAFPFCRPSFRADPSRPLTPADVGERLHEIDRASAENLLLALTDDGCTLRNLERFTESFEELQDMTRTILARYGDTFTCYTNVSSVGHIGTLNFGKPMGWSPMTFYGEDCGLVVVSDTEVGLFWAFGDI
ncbi:hypothetical protein PV721_18410 [Streptomyces sp. MB09-01]|uniref:hypothetical protein n=1 Tax=Streptomyces sp. MB09-01 TaxID=3028666 RepID=UPI0029BD40B1|nr:hypothetical protein [Streptomyces sp. MB09-01]MDX3536313.1 hypothetical protein [Streptomyces sp. MB09-01]